ncbi:MAG: SDR family oxidoreductase [Aquamicrobium sp.]|uniref:SDR family NAD(P)-dependent oxidoreductase n=1 Tax=Aquamicrobium sp. TaxID=1872579 RepID=UPI00349E8195|nr:SDR family oxidoreductase [Aquamicrobium sp.]
MTGSRPESVLITGGASGIGLACARAFAAEGYSVGLFDLDRDKAEAAAAGLGIGDRATAFCGSVTEEGDLAAAVAAMEDRFGGVDCVVTSAGIVKVEPAFEVAPETFRNTLEVNVLGTWLAAQAAARSMAKAGGGSIVMLGSVYGAGGAPHRAAYCASKGAVHMLVESLAVEWGGLGIRVNAVAPTGVRTPMIDRLVAEGLYDMKGVHGRTPLGRLAEPEEVADACLFLAGRRAAMVTGHVLRVDGGWLANGYILN